MSAVVSCGFCGVGKSERFVEEGGEKNEQRKKTIKYRDKKFGT